MTTSSLVPRPYNVAINGHCYMVDLEFKPWKREAYRHRSVDQLRAQADTANEPGEQSLNPQGLWRRTQDSWHLGAGQEHLDRKDSNEFQFHRSTGVNVWSRWKASLLNDVSLALTQGSGVVLDYGDQQNSNSLTYGMGLLVAGQYVYAWTNSSVTGATVMQYATTLNGAATVWTSVNIPAGFTLITSACTDGTNIYFAIDGAGGAVGVWKAALGSTTLTQYVTSTLTAPVIAFVMGRLMLSSGPSIYNITAGGVLPTPLMTSNYPKFQWTGFTEGQSVIYACGYVPNAIDKSFVYRIGIATDGASLSAPVIAGKLPFGEAALGIYGYVGGNGMIGTSRGLRFYQSSSSNLNEDLIIGPLIGPDQGLVKSVRQFAAFDRFIWFNWDAYAPNMSGLGRVDLTALNNGVPAFASDLMSPVNNGLITGLGFLNKNGAVFAVWDGTNMYVYHDNAYTGTATPVASGTIDSGLMTYGIVDPKVAGFVDIESDSTTGTISPSVAFDNGSFTSLGTEGPNAVFAEFGVTNNPSFHSAEIRETLTRSGTASPVLRRHTLRSIPAAVTPIDITCAVLLSEELNVGGVDTPLVPSTELAFFESLRLSKQVFTFQEASQSYSVTLESYDWTPEQMSRDGTQMNGICVVGMRTVV